MFGNPSAAAWGASQWGTLLAVPGEQVYLDSVALKTIDVSGGVDSVGGIEDVDVSAGLDSVTLAVVDVSFGVDFAPVPLDSEYFAAEGVAPYLLVEIQLPGGTLRVSSQCVSALGQAWDERLVNVADVLRTVGRGTDDVRLELDDTDTDGQVRLRDVFIANPPEGSAVLIYLGVRGAPDSQHLRLFRGAIEEVTGFSSATVQVRALRSEAVSDELVGVLVTEAAYPNAPDTAISAPLPTVFGSVDAHEGVVTGSALVGTLVRATLAWEQVLVLDSTEGWPLSGTVQVNGEFISYTGITGNNLAPCARGQGGTTAADIGIGAKVRFYNGFSVTFAGHALAGLTNVRSLLPDGTLGELAPAPASVDPNTATVAWSEVPAIRDPSAVPAFMRVHFNLAGPANTAVNPTGAARDAVGYGAFSTANVGVGQLLQLVANVDELGQPGDIERVWLAVVFDPGDENDAPGLRAAVDGVNFICLPQDNVPQEVTRTDEKTGDRYYDVPPPSVAVTPASEEPYEIHPRRVIWPGIWAYEALAGRVVDSNLDTEAVYMFAGVGEAQIVGNADAVFSVPEDYESPIKGTATSAKIVFVAGWERTPLTSHFSVYLRENGEPIPGTKFKAESRNLAGVGINAIRGRERFEWIIPPEVAAAIVPGIEWVVHPELGVSNGLWVGVELWIEGLSTPPVPVVDVALDARRTVTNYLEVTDRLGLQASPGGTTIAGWEWFGDPARGGRVIFTNGTVTPGRIVETFYAVQFRPFVTQATNNPRVFADVVGLVPSGSPVEISKSLVTSAPPLGLGLSSASFDPAAYAAAAASLATDGVRLDFAVRRLASALDLLSEVAAQADCRETWEDGKHRLIRLPVPDTSLPVARTVRAGDVFTDRGLGFARTPLAQVENLITARWRLYDPSGETSRTTSLTDPASVAAFGNKPSEVVLSLVRDTPTANLILARRLARRSFPRWVLEFEGPLYLLELKLGDLISVDSVGFGAEVAEITQVNLSARGMKRARIQAIAWKK